MIHIRCGDDILDRLRALGRGPAIKWCDPLCQGPLPARLSAAAWRETRARFIAGAYGVSMTAARRRLAREEAALRGALGHDEIVLWFEADLFDQIILVRLLAWFAAHRNRRATLSLVCIGDHPAIPRFIGLGQLDEAQLADLLPRRTPVTKDQLSLATDAWAALAAPAPRPVEAVTAGDIAPLPFLADALRRHLAELPGAGDGLSLTERFALEGIAGGADTAAALFHAVQDVETRPWAGDTMFWHVLDLLAAGEQPLISVNGTPGWKRSADGARATRLALTDDGARVLAGTVDRMALGPLLRWVGGVRIDERTRWRWDRRAEQIVSPA